MAEEMKVTETTATEGSAAEEFADAAAQLEAVEGATPQPQQAEDAELRKWKELSRKNESAAHRAQAELAEARARIKALEDAEQRRADAAEIARETGVPASLIRGTTRDEMEAHAKAIAAAYAWPAAPAVQDAGRFAATSRPLAALTEADQMRAIADSIARQIGVTTN